MYKEAIEELKSRGSERKEPSLEGTRKALELLGSPEKDYDVVLVGGTNGKGSVVEMTSEMLQHEGKNIGVYKSPHLVSIRERIKVNGEMISREEFLELYELINGLDTELTFFEFVTVMAYLYFSKKDIDCAVMEVGMGGRLDATNAADNIGAVITNVGMDHSQYLGDTREEIAGEKAGIIPNKGFLVTGSDLRSIEKTAEKRGCEVLRPVSVKTVEEGFRFRDQSFELPVKGSYQKENLENALTLAGRLGSIPEDIGSSLEGLKCPGRMEKISERPELVYDGAHNREAVEKIVDDIPEDSICMFSAVETKDYVDMIDILEQKVSKFYFTSSSEARSESPEVLSRATSKDFEVSRDPSEAMDDALGEAGPLDSVFVTGSLYLIRDLKRKRS
ncbi:MAG: folylpolyglutamate synthase/dihydrofolate synthase family protein [Candidatus Nanohaloarchaea archaeon]